MALGTLTQPDYLQFEENIIEKLQKSGIPYQKKYDLLYSNIHVRNFSMLFSAYKKISYQYLYPSVLVQKEYFTVELERQIKLFRPDILFTQLEGAMQVIGLGERYRIPVMLFTQDVGKEMIRTLKHIHDWYNVYVVYISQFARKKLSPLVKGQSSVIYHALYKDKYFVPKGKDNTYITMINPVKEKGAATVFSIISRMREKQFLLVEGWRKFKDLRYNFSQLNNVVCMPRQDDMRTVYQKTKILLIPSVWDETFGRVAIEAGISGIPSIAYDKGGLSEAVGKGGIMISANGNVSAWMKAITVLDKDEIYYRQLSCEARRHAETFLITNVGPQLIRVCQKLLHS